MKDFQKLKSAVLKDIEQVIEQVSRNDIERLLEALLASRRIFVMGAGRTMFMCQAFAKRLCHLGISAGVVGETVTPPIAEGDLLIASSSSGETMSTVTISKLAKKYGAKVASLTSQADSSLGKLSDICILVPYSQASAEVSLAVGREDNASSSGEVPVQEGKLILPMASVFEEALLVIFDCVALMLKERLGVKDEEMWSRHANLE